MHLVDIGINLAHDSFDSDRDAVLARAREVGVERMIVTGTSLEGSREAFALAQSLPGVLWSTAGVHPHHAGDYSAATATELRTLLIEPAVVAVGECGLDYFRNFSEPAHQREAFAAQLELACTTGMPLFLHQRDAHEDLVVMLHDAGSELPPAVVHCFTGSEAELEDYLAMGLYIGITGWICDERRGTHLREIVARIPADRLMLETDAPYLLPRDLKPRPATRRNEPMWLAHIAATVASCTGETVESLAARTTKNAESFFRLPVPSVQS